jgi:thiol-disulfide isomerase/thioredoxin
MILMNLIRRTSITQAVLLIIIFFIMTPDAGAGVTIQKISESALDELIKADNNKILITFMAAWCGPCIDELPVLNKLYQKYQKQGLKLIGISIDLEGPKAMQPIVDKLKISFPIYWYGDTAVQKFSLFVIPMIFLVKDGRIVEKLPGRRSEKELNKKIREFLGK